MQTMQLPNLGAGRARPPSHWAGPLAASNIFFLPSIPDMASTFFLQSLSSTGRFCKKTQQGVRLYHWKNESRLCCVVSRDCELEQVHKILSLLMLCLRLWDVTWEFLMRILYDSSSWHRLTHTHTLSRELCLVCSHFLAYRQSPPGSGLLLPTSNTPIITYINTLFRSLVVICIL